MTATAPSANAEPASVSRETSSSARSTVSVGGWQRKGSTNLTGSTSATSLPRPFDEPVETTSAAAIAAPWADPVANDATAKLAPEPVVSATRIRHVSASAQSPGGPLKWRVRADETSPDVVVAGTTPRNSMRNSMRDAPSTIRPTVFLQADPNGSEPIVPADDSMELNSPHQAESREPRVAQGVAPRPTDPAVPAESALEPAGKTPPAPKPVRRVPTAEPLRPEFRAPRTGPPMPREQVEPAPARPGLVPQPMRRGREADLNLLRDVPCERMYGPDKNRNCCAEEMLCGEARRRVKELNISRIKVDITPTCNLSGSWSDAPETKCGWQLELSPPRTWKNRIGQEIAQGRFTGISNARVNIVNEDGETTKVMLRELCEDDRCFVTAWCGLPFECGLVDEPLLARSWQPLTMTWRASGLCHKPLYFEEVQLERYGHTLGPVVQPFVSGAHFFTNIALLPYHMGIHPMNECQYALGYYRPGSCAPRMIPPFPLSARGALLEAGVVVGGVYIFP